MIREHDSVVLTRDLPAVGLVAGDVGVVVHVYGNGAAYEVEFMRYDGKTIAVETLEAASVRDVGTRDVPHVRQLAAQS
jgi:ATP-dependent exoDNAse (exonuclease V) alpha subunit